jgi:hypothetical protein
VWLVNRRRVDRGDVDGGFASRLLDRHLHIQGLVNDRVCRAVINETAGGPGATVGEANGTGVIPRTGVTS